MRPTGPVLLYGGVGVAATGFALIALTWGRVAALESVALQLPHLVSGGLTGLGLVIVGAATVNVHAKQREGAQRERQTQQLLEILRQLDRARDGTGEADRADGGAAGGAALDTGSDSPEASDLTEELQWGR